MPWRLLSRRQGEYVIINHHNFPGGNDGRHKRLQSGRVADHLGQIDDPQRKAYGNIRYKLADSNCYNLYGDIVLCGDCREMEKIGKLKRDFLKGFPELPGEIPDESAFRRVLQCLKPPGLQRWLEGLTYGYKNTGESGG
jgi:hypothetical protein